MSWKGFNTAFGIKKTTSWGSEVAVGADEGILIVSESLAPDAQDVENNSLIGSPFQGASDKGMELHSGDVNLVADYETIHRMLAFAMGTAGNPTQQGTTTAYKHHLRMAASLAGIMATLVIGSGDGAEFVREYPSSKFNGFSGNVEKGGQLQATFPQIPSSLNINTTTGTNKNDTIDDVALPANGGKFFPNFNDLEVLINDAAGSGLASSDEIYVSSVSFTVEGAMPTDDVTTKYAPLVDEPERDGFVMVTGTLNFSKLTTAARITDLLSKTKKKMTWTFTGPQIESPYNYQLKLWFSDVVFQSGSTFNVAGPGRVPESVNFKAHTPTAAHTDFPQAEALVVDVVNTDTADPLG